MSAFNILKSISDVIVGKRFKLVSPTMYDAKHGPDKVSVMIFHEDENGHLAKKYKITVEDISNTFKYGEEEN